MEDWDVYRFVLAIDRHGGLSGAARALRVNHATVSRQLDKAEAQLGARLFDRLPSGLIATEAGRIVVHRAKAMERELIALNLDMTPEEQGPLTLTAPPLLLNTQLAQDLADFISTHPRINLSILSDNRVFDLNQREADVAIRVEREPSPGLWGRKLTEQKTGWFASPLLLERYAGALHGSGEAIPVISFAGWPEPLPKELRDRLPNAYIATVCDDLPGALGLAVAGVGLLRCALIVATIEPRLHFIKDLPTRNYAPVWVLTRKDLRRAPKVRLLMQFLGERFKGSTRFTTCASPTSGCLHKPSE